MAKQTKPLGQAYYDDVEALKANGVSNAEAIRQVAKTYGKKENAVRGSIHQYKTRRLGKTTTPRRTRKNSGISVDDAVAGARQMLEQALGLIDREIEAAKDELASAQRHYEDLKSSAEARKADLAKKIKALS